MGKSLHKSVVLMALALSSTTFTAVDATPAGKPNRLLVKAFTYGDKTGDMPAGTLSRQEFYYYNTAGRQIGYFEKAREYTDKGVADFFTPTTITKYYFDANGNTTNKDTYQWGQYEYQDWVWNKSKNNEVYVYDDAGRLTSDTTSTNYFEYTYNPDGTLAEVKRYLKTKKTLSQKFTYSQYDKNGNACHMSSTGAYDSYIYEEDMEYDADGNMTEKYTYKNVKDSKGQPSVQPVSLETWTYENGYLRSYVKDNYDEKGDEEPYGKTIYAPVDGNENIVDVCDSTYSSGKWYEGDLPQRLFYTDFTDMADMTKMELMVEPDAERANRARLEFTLPELAMSQKCAFCIYRDCVPVDTVALADVYDDATGKCVYKDVVMKNGTYTYFVQPLFAPNDELLDELSDADVEWTGYCSTMPVDVTYDTQLPGITDLALTGASKKITGTVANLQKIYYAELSWKNPDDMAKYGFQKNSVYFEGAGVSELDTTDVSANKASVALYNEDVKAYVLTTYELGKVRSESVDVKIKDLDQLIAAGISEVSLADDVKLTLNGKSLQFGDDADVRVYTLDGQMVKAQRSARSVRLDELPSATYVISVEKNGKTIVCKYSAK